MSNIGNSNSVEASNGSTIVDLDSAIIRLPNDNSAINFYDSSNTNIRASIEWNETEKDFSITNFSNNTTSYDMNLISNTTKALTITGDNHYVGINTTLPQGRFEVSDSSNQVVISHNTEPTIDKATLAVGSTGIFSVSPISGQTTLSGGISLIANPNYGSDIETGVSPLIYSSSIGGGLGQDGHLIISPRIDPAGGSIFLVTGETTSNSALARVEINKLGSTVIKGSAQSNYPSLGGVQFRTEAIAFTDLSTSASGTASLASFVSFGGGSIASVNSSVTTTNATSVYIASAPTASTNQTITNAYALFVDSGLSRFDSGLCFGSDQSTLSAYYSDNVDIDLFNVWSADQTVNFSYQRTGNIVHLTTNQVIATSNSAAGISSRTALPSVIRPSTAIQIPIMMYNNGSVLGVITIQTSGYISFTSSVAGGNFSSGVDVGTLLTSISYEI